MAAFSQLSLLPYSVGGVDTPKPKFSSIHFSHSPFPLAPSCSQQSRRPKSLQVSASISVSNPQVRTDPDDLVSSILSKVMQTDGGVLLKDEEHKDVAEVAQELQKYCVSEPVKCPLIFGEWDVVYCSRPTSPGGGYRSALGRLFFKTNQMIQVVEAPDIVRNKVCFSLFGFLNGEVSLKGKLTALDGEWIQVVFEAPELKVGSLEVQYGGQSEVKLRITYIDDKIRLGKWKSKYNHYYELQWNHAARVGSFCKKSNYFYIIIVNVEGSSKSYYGTNWETKTGKVCLLELLDLVI